MKTTKFIKVLPVAVLALSILAASARADDHESDRRRVEYNRHHHHHDRHGVDIGIGIGGVGVGVYSHRGYRRDRTIVVEDDRGYYGGNGIEVGVQRRLARSGYYNGPIDGDIGPGTRASIRAYQLDHGLAPTAHINRALLVSLHLE